MILSPIFYKIKCDKQNYKTLSELFENIFNNHKQSKTLEKTINTYDNIKESLIQKNKNIVKKILKRIFSK